jgi:hypothetical protein
VHAFAPNRRVVEDEIARNPALAEQARGAKVLSYFAANPSAS